METYFTQTSFSGVCVIRWLFFIVHNSCAYEAIINAELQVNKYGLGSVKFLLTNEFINWYYLLSKLCTKFNYGMHRTVCVYYPK